MLWTSGILRRIVVSYIDTKVSKEHALTIFRAEFLKMAVVSPSETLGHIHQTTQCHNTDYYNTNHTAVRTKNLHLCTAENTTINIRHIIFFI
jgi:hypothetical protein